MKVSSKAPASASPSPLSSAPSAGWLTPATAPARATTSPSPSSAAWATRLTTAISASRASFSPAPSEQGHPRQLRPERVREPLAQSPHRPSPQGHLQGNRAAARHLQGRRAGSRHRHLRPRRRLPRQCAAGQVRQQIRSGAARRSTVYACRLARRKTEHRIGSGVRACRLPTDRRKLIE